MRKKGLYRSLSIFVSTAIALSSGAAYTIPTYAEEAYEGYQEVTEQTTDTDDQAKAAAEEEAARLAAEAEAARLAAESEAARIAEEEAARIAAESEAACLAAESEAAAAAAAESEAARIAAESEAAAQQAAQTSEAVETYTESAENYAQSPEPEQTQPASETTVPAPETQVPAEGEQTPQTELQPQDVPQGEMLSQLYYENGTTSIYVSRENGEMFSAGTAFTDERLKQVLEKIEDLPEERSKKIKEAFLTPVLDEILFRSGLAESKEEITDEVRNAYASLFEGMVIKHKRYLPSISDPEGNKDTETVFSWIYSVTDEETVEKIKKGECSFAGFIIDGWNDTYLSEETSLDELSLKATMLGEDEGYEVTYDEEASRYYILFNAPAKPVVFTMLNNTFEYTEPVEPETPGKEDYTTEGEGKDNTENTGKESEPENATPGETYPDKTQETTGKDNTGTTNTGNTGNTGKTNTGSNTGSNTGTASTGGNKTPVTSALIPSNTPSSKPASTQGTTGKAGTTGTGTSSSAPSAGVPSTSSAQSQKMPISASKASSKTKETETETDPAATVPASSVSGSAAPSAASAPASAPAASPSQLADEAARKLKLKQERLKKAETLAKNTAPFMATAAAPIKNELIGYGIVEGFKGVEKLPDMLKKDARSFVKEKLEKKIAEAAAAAEGEARENNEGNNATALPSQKSPILPSRKANTAEEGSGSRSGGSGPDTTKISKDHLAGG